MALAAVNLDDKYTLESGRVYMTGLQALVRLPVMQRQLDAAAGLNTGGFISGYRGSPLGAYDAELWKASRFLANNHIHFQPGVNEELAATAVWGTQQFNLWPSAKYDGAFGIWYGKGPGVDRCGDAFKHGNFAGSSEHGGVLLMAGDDHGCKSSTLPHQSEYAFIAASIPVINPANVQEYIDFGLYGFALSRYSGCWVGFKAVGDTVESSASVSIDPSRIDIRIPEDFELPPGGLNIRPNDVAFLPMEDRLLNWKLPAAQAFVRANGLDRIIMDSPAARLGIISTGKAYLDLRQAMDELGIDQRAAAALGIRLYKVAMTWPLEPQGALDFCKGLDQVLVVEEKRGLIEDQLKQLLFNATDMPRIVVGKRDESNAPLLPANGELTPAMVAAAVVDRIKRYHQDTRLFDQRLARLESIESAANQAPAKLTRSPYFCSGCPHNTSTRIPDGSRAMAGIGCHGMVLWMTERNTGTIAHMGGEGVNWIGQAPFSNDQHVFQNLGDGTYFHSGLMAIRATIAAGVNITYKILYNDAVAMTGGQPHDGNVTPWEISRQVHSEGAKRIVVVSDQPDKYPGDTAWAPGVTIRPREELDQVQRELREVEGVTVLIYDQTCAAEKRRRRKRGQLPDPAKRVFINDLVCEGCGDCSEQSNCVSVQPLDTEWGRKRQIDQSNCNKDFSCVKGFCPSFVTVHGGQVRKAAPDVATESKADNSGSQADPFAGLPLPTLPAASEPYGILITGIGGTGVVTIAALLGMAAHLEGKGVSVLDQAGMSQKNGAVTSHVRIADQPGQLHSVRIATGGARLMLGCDIVTAVAPTSLATLNQNVSHAMVNSYVAPPAGFIRDQSIDLSADVMVKRISAAVGSEHGTFINATELATALLGDAIASNIFMLGAAFQKGLVPLSLEALLRAIELNGVAVASNRRALQWGRLAAHDLAQVEQAAKPMIRSIQPTTIARELGAVADRRQAFLTDYKNTGYGRRYRTLVDRVAAAERASAPGCSGLAETVARNYFKLLAYKDEYEVARLYSNGDFERKLAQQFEGDYRLQVHLAPPLLARRHPQTGILQKRQYGPWVFKAFKLLARLRWLRGTVLDPFGYTAERKTERRLITDYERLIEQIVGDLSPINHDWARQLAALPEQIRGYGHIKERHIQAAQEEQRRLLPLFQSPPEPVEKVA